ncbi:MAG: apolipoprotein N-acyltransferase [Candidatus Omnitrophica bacterium]|nr:apolipoprotein N-acyltransferase [Candidatus Omnitrophota bacterium]
MALMFSLSSALLLWAVFPPVNAWGLAWVALVPLLCALDRARSGRAAFGLAYAAGLAFFVAALVWIHYVTTLGLIFLSAYCALYFGVFGWLYYFLTRRKFAFLPLALLLSAGWVILEYIRSVALTGFGWASLGDSQASLPGAALLASVTGVSGWSFLVLAANFTIKEMFFGVQKKEARIFAGVLAACLVMIAGTSFSGVQVKRANGFKVALIQPNIALSEAWDPAGKADIVRGLIDLSRQALADKPRLIVWPESSFPNFMWDQPELLAEVQAFARESGAYLLFGAITRDGDKYFNSAVLMGPAGEVLDTKSKQHLVLFGEYIPFRRQLPFLQDIVGIDDFTPGAADALFNVPGLGKFGVLVCFEDTISELARRYARLGAGFLVNITNDAWFRASGQPAMHLDKARFRAAENARPLLRATNTGESCVVSADGREGACVQDNQGRRVLTRGFVVTSVYPEVQMTWYTKCGEWFIVLCVLILAAGLVASFRKKKPAAQGSNKILLIDDERTLHVMLKPILGSYGFEVISAMNGEEGLALAASEQPGLILLDVIMPTIKGREVCKRLKASPETAHIPVLFLTAKASDDDVKMEMAAGAVGHVTKPINSASLVRLIKKTIAL